MKAEAIELLPQWSVKSVRAPRVLMFAPLFALAALLALPIDLIVARFSLLQSAPGDFRKALNLAEVFGHGFGVAMICLAVAVLDPINRRKLPRVLGCAILPGLAALLLKTVVGRMRPHSYLDQGEMNLPNSVSDTFVGWLPSHSLGDATVLAAHGMQSFPSGHTATAVGCAIGLAWLYPRGQWLFWTYALLVALQRVESGAHFVSDTLSSAAIACLISGLCIDDRVFGRWFVGWENPKSAAVDSSPT